jgi:flagellar hook assembly protein FlgD
LGGKILAYPNPFRDEVHFRFQLDAFAIEDMSIIIYDLMGRKIRELKLVRNAYGDYELIWDGKDEFGQMVEPGQYMVQLQLPDRVLSTKIVKW